MLDQLQLNELTTTAEKAAEIAADYISSQVSETHEISLKSGVDSLARQVVTAIDLESQRLILDELSASIKQYDLGLLTEELHHDGSRFVKDYFWCIDPLDGTLPFTERKPGYAVSLALVSQSGESMIGIVVDPQQDHTYVAIRGQGCKINGQPFEYKLKSRDQLNCNFDRSFAETERYPNTINTLESISRG